VGNGIQDIANKLYLIGFEMHLQGTGSRGLKVLLKHAVSKIVQAPYRKMYSLFHSHQTILWGNKSCSS
jgi:hypothetical protein